MTTLVRRNTRIALLAALIGLLAVVPLIAPSPAVARPYLIITDPDPLGGDPTGDDRPAPAPKPVNKAAGAAVRASETQRYVVRSHVTVVSGQWILRYLISIPLR
jgi:hypothetical protein